MASATGLVMGDRQFQTAGVATRHQVDPLRAVSGVRVEYDKSRNVRRVVAARNGVPVTGGYVWRGRRRPAWAVRAVEAAAREHPEE
jgi:hypothetical protein